jgi:hypothetical protein
MKKWPHKRGGLSWGGQFSSFLLSQCIWYMALYEGCLINIQFMHTFLNNQMCFEDDEKNILTIREDKKDKYLGLKSDPPYYLWIQFSSFLLSQCIWYMALYEGCLINIQFMHTFLNNQMCFFTSHSLFSIRCWIFNTTTIVSSTMTDFIISHNIFME